MKQMRTGPYIPCASSKCFYKLAPTVINIHPYPEDNCKLNTQCSPPALCLITNKCAFKLNEAHLKGENKQEALPSNSTKNL